MIFAPRPYSVCKEIDFSREIEFDDPLLCLVDYDDTAAKEFGVGYGLSAIRDARKEQQADEYHARQERRAGAQEVRDTAALEPQLMGGKSSTYNKGDFHYKGAGGKEDTDSSKGFFKGGKKGAGASEDGYFNYYPGGGPPARINPSTGGEYHSGQDSGATQERGALGTGRYAKYAGVQLQ